VALSSLSRIQLLVRRLWSNVLVECSSLSIGLSSIVGLKSKLFSADYVETDKACFAEEGLNEILNLADNQRQSFIRHQTLSSLGLLPGAKSAKKSGNHIFPENRNDLGVSIRSSEPKNEITEPVSVKQKQHPFLYDELDRNMKLVNDAKVMTCVRRREDPRMRKERKQESKMATKKAPKIGRKKDFFDKLFGG
jgi:hypothetical protein